MKISTIARQAALGIAILCTVAPLVQAQEPSVAVESVGSITFMSGGIGKDQQNFMREAGKDFNLRFGFSERKDNEFIVGTELLIADMQGNPVFALPHAGPMVNVDLPDGKYRITANYQGQNETRLITLRREAGQDIHFHWNGRPKVEPIAVHDETSAKAD
jgi:hypothetical protein